MKLFDILLFLIRSELWGERIMKKGLTEKGFKIMLALAERQTVEGMMCAALLESGVHLQRLQANTLFVILNKIANRSDKVNGEVVALTQLLQKHSIRFFVVKGAVVATRYRHPLYRVSGDIDFYCNGEDLEKAKTVIAQEWGVEIESPEHDLSLHYGFSHNDVDYEMHFCLNRFLDSGNQRYFDNLIATTPLSSVVINGVAIPVLDQRLNVVYTFLHLWHHLLEVGVGLRQVCDMAVLLHELQLQNDPAVNHDICVILDTLGFTKAFECLEWMLARHLGLEEKLLPVPISADYSAYVDKMIKIIAKRGNFGMYGRKNRVRSGFGYFVEQFFIKIAHYRRFYSLSPRENRAFFLHELPLKVGMALTGRLR